MPPEAAPQVDVTLADPTATPQAAPRAERRPFRVMPPSEGGQSAAAPDAEPAADGGTPAPAKPAENPDQKYASLSKRVADQERALRKSAQERKTEQAELSRLRDLEAKLKADPYSVIDPDVLTQRVLKGVEKPKPEEKALSEAELARKELADLKAAMAEKEAKGERQALLSGLAQEMAGREDLAFSTWLGKPEELLTRIEKFKAEHGEATPEDAEQIAAELESEVRESVLEQLRDGVKRVPKLREAVLELAKSLAPKSESEPDQRVSDGQTRSAAPVLRSKTLSTSQAATVSERAAPSKTTRTYDEKVAAIEAKIAKRRAGK